MRILILLLTHFLAAMPDRVLVGAVAVGATLGASGS